jgi:hypothetical protein
MWHDRTMSDEEPVAEEEEAVEGGAPGYPAGGQTPDLDTNRPDTEGPIPVEPTPAEEEEVSEEE